MEEAFKEACKAMDRQEVPIGCVLVKDEKVLARGSNATNDLRNGTRHAEMEAFDDAWKDCKTSEERCSKTEGCDLFVTCEPCIMCAGALSLVGVRRVVFGCKNDRFGGNGSILSLHDSACGTCSGQVNKAPGRPYQVLGGLQAERAVAMLKDFYACGNPNAPVPHRPIQPRQ